MPAALPPDTEATIAPDGTVSAKQANGTVTPMGKLKLVTAETKLVRGEDGLFRGPDGDLPAVLWTELDGLTARLG